MRPPPPPRTKAAFLSASAFRLCPPRAVRVATLDPGAAASDCAGGLVRGIGLPALALRPRILCPLAPLHPRSLDPSRFRWTTTRVVGRWRHSGPPRPGPAFLIPRSLDPWIRRYHPTRYVLAVPNRALSRKPWSLRARTGCCSLRMALASTCRTRSRVTLKILPTSSSV